MTFTTCEYWFQLVDNFTVRALVETNTSISHQSWLVVYNRVALTGRAYLIAGRVPANNSKHHHQRKHQTLPQPFCSFSPQPRSSFSYPTYLTTPIQTCVICVSLPPQATKTISSTRRDGGDLVPSAQTHQQEASSILFGSGSVAAEVELVGRNRHDEGFSTAGLVAQRQCPHLLSTL